MHVSTFRRLVILVASATLLASVAMTTVAAPASAANKALCRGQVATIVGTNKGERIVGTNKRDVIVARGGNDVIIGRGGNDLICGGGGADRIVGRAGLDRLYGNAGPDRIFGGNGPDRIFGGTGNDLLAGQVGNDTHVGGPGNDTLTGGIGTDTCLQNRGSGAQVSCERPDRDADGYADHADACPTQGSQGYGVDGAGCPVPAFQSICAEAGGIYSAGGAYEFHCDFPLGAATFLDAGQWFALSSALDAFCTHPPLTSNFSFPIGPGEAFCPAA